MTTVVEDHKPHNQLLLCLENWFRHFVCTSITYSCLAVHYMLVPIEVPYMFFKYAFWHSCVIISFILSDLLKLSTLLKLNFEILGNVVETQRSLLFTSKNVTKYKRKNMIAYRKIKEILNYFHILPLSPREGITGILILNKVPNFVWNYVLPFPKFLFEDTFESVSIREGKVVVTLPQKVPIPTIVIKDEDEDSSTGYISSNGEGTHFSSESSDAEDQRNAILNGGQMENNREQMMNNREPMVNNSRERMVNNIDHE